jgi:hypothetical protein
MCCVWLYIPVCLIQVQLDVHYIFYFLNNVSSKSFGSHLHPSSGAQLQRTAIVLYLWKTEVLVSSGVEVYFIWICVYSCFEVSCDIFVPVCVSLDMFCYCVVMMHDFFADSFYAIFVYLRFGALFHWSRYWFGTPLHLSTVSYRLVREGFARRVLVGLELNIYVTKMYGTTNIKCIYLLTTLETQRYGQYEYKAKAEAPPPPSSCDTRFLWF